jgi:hypothetical protein
MEQWGRSGGLVHVGFDRTYKKDRTDAEKAKDVALAAYHEAAPAADVEGLKRLRDRGVYVVGLGPRGGAPPGDVVGACDAWIDTSAPGVNGDTAACLSNLVHGWCLTGEFVAALTRRGKMPPLWKSFGYDDGRTWAETYFGKKQFHDDLAVPPVAAGELARSYVRQVRHAIRRLRTDEAALVEAVDRVILGGRMSAQTRKVILEQLAEVQNPVQARALAVGLALGGPDFQKQ